jgi:hypothetical protein
VDPAEVEEVDPAEVGPEEEEDPQTPAFSSSQ